ncbi:hypothetical protein BLOT_014024 [Blomia tropicalis]|nr:hypothetical protein BLOT_014024 [Blomia tropicalis]
MIPVGKPSDDFELSNANKHFTPSLAPEVSTIFLQLEGNPSLSSIYSATCRRTISIPAESEYDPTDRPPQ